MSLSVKTAVASAVLLLSAGAAQADITAYTSQSSYLAAVGNTGVDTYDDLDFEPTEGPVIRNAGDYSYELSTGPEDIALWGASDDGSDFWVTPGWSGDNLTFTLSGPISGAGGFFFGSDVFGFSSPVDGITITATDTSGATLTYTIDAPDPGSFVGFVSNVQLTSLVVEAGDPAGVFATVNDLHLSVSAVPEPSTYAMMLAGLGLAGFAARRQRKS